MKIIFTSILALALAFAPFITFGQSAHTINSPCNLSVTIDSIVVKPCFRMGAANAVNGGSCGCANTLWAIVAGGTAPYTYEWTTTGGAVSGTADTLHGACYELWFVKVRDANGCLDSASLNVIIPPTDTTSSSSAGINQVGIMNDGLRIYPNPAKDVLNIECLMANETSQITIYTMLGNVVYQSAFTTQHNIIDVSAFADGNYFLKIVSNNGQRIAKFLVETNR